MKTWEAYNRRNRTKDLLFKNAFRAVRIYGIDADDLPDIFREVAEDIEIEFRRNVQEKK
jgi:hypothetical protein